jgi:hypothetical protein
VPERYGDIVLKKMRNAKIGNRAVVVDSAERTGEEVKRDKAARNNEAAASRTTRTRRELIREVREARREGRQAPKVADAPKKSKKKSARQMKDEQQYKPTGKKDDWRQFFQ